MAEILQDRCFEESEGPLMKHYHDEEWGTPLHDDRLLFEFLALCGVQAGLSWNTIMNKRENFRKAFDGFEPDKIASYTDADRERLLADSGIIRNRLKIDSIINNAQRVLEAQKKFGSFDQYIWQFTDHKMLRRPGVYTWGDVPAESGESAAMAIDLKKRGFKLVGPVICYAYMQTIGMVNDHLIGCFRAPEK